MTLAGLPFRKSFGKIEALADQGRDAESPALRGLLEQAHLAITDPAGDDEFFWIVGHSRHFGLHAKIGILPFTFLQRGCQWHKISGTSVKTGI